MDIKKENKKLKETVGDLYMLIEDLKKMADSKRRMKNGNSSVISADNVEEFLKSAKQSD